mgnify:CR=1 FL=1
MKRLNDDSISDKELTEFELFKKLKELHGTIPAQKMARDIKINESIDTLMTSTYSNVEECLREMTKILRRIHNKN